MRRRNGDTQLRVLEREFVASPSFALAAKLVSEWARRGGWNPALFPAVNELLAGPLAVVAKAWIEQAFSSFSEKESVASWPSGGPPLPQHEIQLRQSRSSFNGCASYVQNALARQSAPCTDFYGTPLEEILELRMPTDRGIEFEGRLVYSDVEPPEEEHSWSRMFLRAIKDEPVFVARGIFYGYRHHSLLGSDARFYPAAIMPWGLGHSSLDFHVLERVSRLRYDPERFLSGAHYDSPFAFRAIVEPVGHAWPTRCQSWPARSSTTGMGCGSRVGSHGLCENEDCVFHEERQSGRNVDLVRVTIEIAHPLTPLAVRYHEDPGTGPGYTGRLLEVPVGPWVAEEILKKTFER